MTPLIALAALALFTLIVVWPRTADAHCDTLDGPAVADGRRALVTGNLAHALKWIPTEAEAELREVFDACSRVRTQGGDATTVADRLFLETLVRLHRAGEGAGFDGLKPSGTRVDPVVVAADAAIAAGSLAPLVGLVPDDRLPQLDRLLHAALALKEFDADDVAAGRRYIAAYVEFFMFAEGEEHEHHAGHDHHAGHGDHGEHNHHDGHVEHEHHQQDEARADVHHAHSH